MPVNNSTKRHKMSRKRIKKNSEEWQMVVGEASHSNMALERLAVMLGLIYMQKYCKSLISLGNFDSRANRQASFFSLWGNGGRCWGKKGISFSSDTKCGNKHNTSQTILKLHRHLADEIQRPENTWRKDKSRNQREADITTMREPRDRRWWRKGDHLLCFLFFGLIFHFRSSPVCPLINTVQQWFSFPFARFSHVQDVQFRDVVGCRWHASAKDLFVFCLIGFS